MPNRHVALPALIALIVLTVPAPVLAQATGPTAGIGQLLTGMRDGGGWVGIPIEGGRGVFSTTTLPTAALSVAGCVNVWWGHSGSWEILAHESVLGSNLRIQAEPGVGVPFEHDFGMTAQVDFEFHWSEPRDTTLMLWVGLDPTLESPEEACDPYEG